MILRLRSTVSNSKTVEHKLTDIDSILWIREEKKEAVIWSSAISRRCVFYAAANEFDAIADQLTLGYARHTSFSNS